MVSSVVALVGAVAAYGVFSTVSSMLKNIAAAKRSGLQYVVVRMCSSQKLTGDFY
jgi:hypothetical protein